MRLSELIECCQKVMEEHGDLYVDPPGFEEITGVEMGYSVSSEGRQEVAFLIGEDGTSL
jgi:hypothetical protein